MESWRILNLENDKKSGLFFLLLAYLLMMRVESHCHLTPENSDSTLLFRAFMRTGYVVRGKKQRTTEKGAVGLLTLISSVYVSAYKLVNKPYPCRTF
jgi:hypothetical protein